MWTCGNCKRIFQKINQPHSCRSVPLEFHFRNKEKARELFDVLLSKIEANIGVCNIVSLPCCVHLFGSYDFLAALPKKDSIEIRFALRRTLHTSKLKASVPLSGSMTKNCIVIHTKEEIDNECMDWMKESYFLKNYY